MNRKVIYWLGFVLMLLPVLIKAQQRPYYTQYIMNNYIINPAVAGIENYWDVKASHRMQWVGIQDAPVTTYITIHGPLKKDDFGWETATSMRTRGENPRGGCLLAKLSVGCTTSWRWFYDAK